MTLFDELLADLLEEPDEIFGILSDVVNRGRLQADDLPPEPVRILAAYDMLVFLVEKKPRQPTRTWVYPTPTGLGIYALLEREAERVPDGEEAPRNRVRE